MVFCIKAEGDNSLNVALRSSTPIMALLFCPRLEGRVSKPAETAKPGMYIKHTDAYGFILETTGQI